MFCVGHCFVGGSYDSCDIDTVKDGVFRNRFSDWGCLVVWSSHVSVAGKFKPHVWLWLTDVWVSLESLNLRKPVATSKAWGQKNQDIFFVCYFLTWSRWKLFHARLVQLAFLFLTPSFQASYLRCQTFLGDSWRFRMPDNCSQFVSLNLVSSCHGVIYANIFLQVQGVSLVYLPGSANSSGTQGEVK